MALRWLIQRGIVAIPKSSHIERMKQNFDVFDFSLTNDDMAQIETMNHRTLVSEIIPTQHTLSVFIEF